MPKLPIDYSKGIIYGIRCVETGEYIYVGSTTDLTKRKYKHKQGTNQETYREYNRKLYKTIRDKGGFDNIEFAVLEKYPCNDSIELRQKEREWYDKLNTPSNIHNPFTSKDEYTLRNREYKRTQMKKEGYKEYKKNYDNEYRKLNHDKQRLKIKCDCGGCYTLKHRSTHFKTKIHKDYEGQNIVLKDD